MSISHGVYNARMTIQNTENYTSVGTLLLMQKAHHGAGIYGLKLTQIYENPSR